MKVKSEKKGLSRSAVFILSCFAIFFVFIAGVALYWGILGFDDEGTIYRNYGFFFAVMAVSFLVVWLAGLKIFKSKLSDGAKAIFLAVFMMANIMLIMVVTMSLNFGIPFYIILAAIIIGTPLYIRAKKLPGIYWAGAMSVIVIFGGIMMMLMLFI